jgi:membrane protease YdiL (CAAX protease family)
LIDLTAIDSFAFATIALLAVVVPFSGYVEFSLLHRWIRGGESSARIRFYIWSMAFEWAMVLGLLGWWLGRGGSLEEIGLVPRVVTLQWAGVIIGLVLVYLVIDKMNEVLEDSESLDEVNAQLGKLGKLRNLAPHNHEEQRFFLGLSITAGICEEILYRGILTRVLSGVTEWYIAYTLVAVIFGLGHLYQGWRGALKTGAVGALLGFLTWASGSIFIPMILHAVLDMSSGRMLQAAVVHQDRKNRIEF